MAVEYWGDSIAHGYRTTAHGTGVTRVGANPSEILRNVRSKGANYFRGKTIVLSSGLSNGTNMIGTVDTLVGTLKSYGANVVLLGVSNNYKGSTATGSSMNSQLANIASKHGATFNGGFVASKDTVHPQSYNSSAIRITGGQQTAQPTTGGQQTNTRRTPTGGLWGNNYGISDFVPPVANAKITSGEGNRASFRTKNGAMSSSFHKGVDVVGGRDISNITGGTVTFAGHVNGYGNTVVVRNPQGYIVQYAHLASINVSAGQQIGAGQKIGVMGETGNATGVHLDMIVSKDGKVINRQGTAFGDAGGIARRGGSVQAGGQQQAYQPQTTQQGPQLYDIKTPQQTTGGYQPQMAQQQAFDPLNPLKSMLGANIQPDGVGQTVLSDGRSLFQARTPFEENMFSDIFNSSPSAEDEAAGVMVARAVSDAYNDNNSQSLFGSSPFAPYVRQLVQGVNV